MLALHRRAQRAFTLVELSIVLVIIGLIIGGVLTGQQIIQNARVTNAINAIQAYQAQFQTYVQNYGALPGDDLNATARFSADKVADNGDGDGVIAKGSAFESSPTESLLVWSHLRAAGLVKDQTSKADKDGKTNNAVYPTNPFNGIAAFQNGAFGTKGFTTTVLCFDKVPSAAAQAIDARLDDGLSASGTIRASSTSSTGDADATYGKDTTFTLCVRM